MATFTHMPNYDIRNDGAGPYAVFYCESCGREFRSQPISPAASSRTWAAARSAGCCEKCRWWATPWLTMWSARTRAIRTR